MNQPGRAGDYRHSEGDLHSRENVPRYEGISAADLYMDSPTSILPDGEDGESRRFKDHIPTRGSRNGGSSSDEYYRGMLGGHGGGPVHDYNKYYH